MKPLLLARSYNFARMARYQEGTVIQIEAVEKALDLETRSVRAGPAIDCETPVEAKLASKGATGPGSRLRVDSPETRWRTRASLTWWRPQSSSSFQQDRHLRRYCHSVGSRLNPFDLFREAIPVGRWESTAALHPSYHWMPLCLSAQ